MTLLVLGLVLWTAAHLFKRIAPGARDSLATAVGDGPSKGVIALLILVSVVLMVVGFRAAPFAPVYEPPAWGIHVNNLAMFAAVLLMGAGRSKSRARALLRNPMLTGVVVWALAHLLVNGDFASLVLFGWLGLWAVGSIALIDSQEPGWTRPDAGTTAGDVRLVVIAAIIYAVIAAIHAWLGHWPFPR